MLPPAPPLAGTLGAVTDVLQISLPVGMAATLARAWTSWLRYGRRSAHLKATRPDGASFELYAERVKDMRPDDLRELSSRLSNFLEAVRETEDGDEIE